MRNDFAPDANGTHPKKQHELASNFVSHWLRLEISCVTEIKFDLVFRFFILVMVSGVVYVSDSFVLAESFNTQFEILFSGSVLSARGLLRWEHQIETSCVGTKT